MGKVAFLFPGQGVQYPGMVKDICDEYPVAAEVFRRADECLGMNLSGLVFRGTAEELAETEITQPAVLTASLAVCAVLEEKGISPSAVAGLSLGEYTALVAAGALSLEDALPLVQKRGRYMQEAVPRGRGSMVAVMGLDREKVEEVCRNSRAYGEVVPANYNCPGQIVISGEREAVDKASAMAREAGARKTVALRVSAPFHSALMIPAGEKLHTALSPLALIAPRMPFVSNVTATVTTDPSLIKELLIKQVSSPVKWEDSVRTIIGMGIDTFMETGPGKTLAGFMKKISGEVRVISMGNIEAIRNV